MKILILHKWLVMGGAEKILINFLKLLQQSGIKTDLLINYDLKSDNFFQPQIPQGCSYTFVCNYPQYLRQKSSTLKKRKKNIFFKLHYECSKFLDNYRYHRTLVQCLKQNNYDLLIDFSGCLDKAMRSHYILKQIDIPIIRWIHGQLNGNSVLTEKQKKKYYQIFSHQSRVVSICEQMTHQLYKTFPTLPQERFYTLHNPINLAEIHHLSQQEAERLPNFPYILQVSRLVSGKGHEELIDIYAALKQRGIQHKLCFIGDGENRHNLQAKISELGLENDCLLLGTTENPYPYFKAADLFVHTSEHEGLPTVLLESMACGTPVIAMDCPTGPRDILGKNSEYGILIPIHDKTAFANAVYDLLNHKETLAYYEIKSRERVEHFSVEQILPRLSQLLKSTLNNSR